MGQLVRVADGSNDSQGCAWKASGLVAVTDITGRLFHKGIVRGKKEYLYALVSVAMWRSLQGWFERVQGSAGSTESRMGR